MNKTFIIVLAICLVSVHAMVKRDAPAAADNKDEMTNLKEQFEDITNAIKKTFDPEKIKESLNNIIDEVSKGVQKLQNPEKKE